MAPGVRTLDGVLPIRREGEALGTLVVDKVRSDVPVRSISAIVRRINADGADDLYGLQFIQVSPVQMRLVADLMYGDFAVLDRVRSARRRHKGILAGSFQFLVWSIHYTARALRFALVPARKPKPARAPAAERTTGSRLEPSLGAPPQTAVPPTDRATDHAA